MVAHQVYRECSNSMKCETQSNELQPKCYGKTSCHKWTDKEKRQLINYLKDNQPIEKPTPQIYYRQYVDEYDVDVSWNYVRNKVRELRGSYERAKSLQNSMKATETLTEEDGNYEAILFNICPHLEQLDEVFENIDQKDQNSGETKTGNTSFENVFLEYDDTNCSIETSKFFTNEESNTTNFIENCSIIPTEENSRFQSRIVTNSLPHNETVVPDIQPERNGLRKSVYRTSVLRSERLQTHKHKPSGRQSRSGSISIELELKEREMLLKERDQALQNEMFQFKKEKYAKKMELKAAKIENDQKFKALELEMSERLASKELEINESHQNMNQSFRVPTMENELNNIANIPDINEMLVQIKSVETRLEDIEDEQRNQRELIEQILVNQSKMFNVLTKMVGSKTLATQTLFPIKTDEDLNKVNKLAMENMDDIISKIKAIINPGGLHANFDRLFDPKMTANYNYAGVKDKKSLKDAKALMTSIFEAVKTEGKTEKDFIEDMKNSIKMQKNRFFKRKFDERRKKGTKLIK